MSYRLPREGQRKPHQRSAAHTSFYTQQFRSKPVQTCMIFAVWHKCFDIDITLRPDDEWGPYSWRLYMPVCGCNTREQVGTSLLDVMKYPRRAESDTRFGFGFFFLSFFFSFSSLSLSRCRYIPVRVSYRYGAASAGRVAARPVTP